MNPIHQLIVGLICLAVYWLGVGAGSCKDRSSMEFFGPIGAVVNLGAAAAVIVAIIELCKAYQP